MPYMSRINPILIVNGGGSGIGMRIDYSIHISVELVIYDIQR
jgi:hypothetical protein